MTIEAKFNNLKAIDIKTENTILKNASDKIVSLIFFSVQVGKRGFCKIFLSPMRILTNRRQKVNKLMCFSDYGNLGVVQINAADDLAK